MRALHFTSLGLPLLALACSPVERDFPTGSGGATSSTSSSAETSSTGSTGGAGGSGGGLPTGSCTKVGVPFDILSTNDLTAKAELEDTFYLAPDQESTAMVHVIVKDYNQLQLHIRSVLPGATPLGNLAHYGNPGVPPFTARAAWAVNGQLHIEGSLSNTLEELSFDVDSGFGVKPGGVLTSFQTPIECQQSGTLGAAVFAQEGAKARYLAVCNPTMLTLTSRLYAGGWTGAPVLVTEGSDSSPAMSPSFYSFVGGTHLAFFGNDGQTFFSHSDDVAQLGALKPFRLTADADARHGIFFTAPLPDDDGVALLAAHFSLASMTGQYWSGSTPIKSYATLAEVPPPGLELAKDIPSLAAAVTPTLPGWDAKGIVSAGAAGDHKSVSFYWLTRQGRPLVFGQEVYKATDTTVAGAAATVFGDDALVVWIEKIGTTSYQYLVRGQTMSCKLD